MTLLSIVLVVTGLIAGFAFWIISHLLGGKEASPQPRPGRTVVIRWPETPSPFWQQAKQQADMDSQAWRERMRRESQQLAKEFNTRFPGLMAEPTASRWIPEIAFDFMGYKITASRYYGIYNLSCKGKGDFVLVKAGLGELYRACERLVERVEENEPV